MTGILYIIHFSLSTNYVPEKSKGIKIIRFKPVLCECIGNEKLKYCSETAESL